MYIYKVVHGKNVSSCHCLKDNEMLQYFLNKQTNKKEGGGGEEKKCSFSVGQTKMTEQNKLITVQTCSAQF